MCEIVLATGIAPRLSELKASILLSTTKQRPYLGIHYTWCPYLIFILLVHMFDKSPHATAINEPADPNQPKREEI